MAGMARAPESRGMAALHSMESAVSRQANALAHGVHEMEARVAHGVHDLEAKVEAKVSAAVHKLDAKASYRYRLRQEREKEEAAQPKDLRMRISDVVRSNAFEMLMGVVVMVNFLLICYQVNDEAECYPPPDPFATPEECKDMKSESLVAWLIFLFVFIYTFELACRLYVERCAFFNSGWNNLDAVVVVSGLSSELLSESDAISALRILRTVRLFRVFRVLVAFRELYVIFLSIVTTIKSLLSATMLLFALLTLWSLILVEHIHPLTSAMTFQDCPRCSEAFSSILRSNLSLFQNLVTGDSWGQIHVPLIEEHPWTAGLILGACISISFGMMNLVLAIIIQRAQDARDGDAALKAEELARGHDHRKSALMDYCARMDVDNSGMIVLQELHEGYREHEDFRTLLASLDIQEEELTAVFRVLDSDDSGEVSYEEFVEELIRIQTRDIRTLLTFMKVNVNDCLHQLHVITERIDTMQTGPPVEGQECAAHVERPQHRDKHTQTPTARDPENVAAGENGPRDGDGPAELCEGDGRPLPRRRAEQSHGEPRRPEADPHDAVRGAHVQHPERAQAARRHEGTVVESSAPAAAILGAGAGGHRRQGWGSLPVHRRQHGPGRQSSCLKEPPLRWIGVVGTGRKLQHQRLEHVHVRSIGTKAAGPKRRRAAQPPLHQGQRRRGAARADGHVRNRPLSGMTCLPGRHT